VIALLLATVVQTPSEPFVALHGGKLLPIRSFDVGTSDEIARLRKSPADLIIVRFHIWGVKPNEVAQSLQKGPNGRRAVLVEFPSLGARPSNGLLWRSDWDMNHDGTPDEDAPTWLKRRNADGWYPLDSASPTLRNRILGANGIVAKVAHAGFDGIVVAPVSDPKRKEGFDARLLSDIMSTGRRHRSGFITLMRNPKGYMDFPVVRTMMDGFVADGLFYGDEELNVPSDAAFVEDTVKRLEWASKRQKLVLSIAYTNDPIQIAENRKLAKERGFVPLARSKKFFEREPAVEPR
jgi:hypothetical protein